MSNAIQTLPKRGPAWGMRQTAAARSKIQASRLVERLQAFANGHEDKATGCRVEMSNAQVRAALGLLAKVMPDLRESDITHTHKVETETPDAMVHRLKGMLGEQGADELLQRIGWQRHVKDAIDATPSE